MTGAKEKPLAGKRVLVTRAPEQATEFVRALTEAGAQAILLPMVGFDRPEDFGPLDEALQRLDGFDWLIFTSQNAVRAFAERAAEVGGNAAGRSGLHVAAVGPATASAAREAGFQVEYVARENRGAALAAELGERLRGKSVLLPRSDRAGKDLPRALQEHGAEVTDLIAYSTGMAKTFDEANLGMLRDGKFDVAAFFSPSAFHNFSEIVGAETLAAWNGKVTLAAIGPVTAAALREAGLQVDIVAPEATVQALVSALEEHYAAKGRAGVRGV